MCLAISLGDFNHQEGDPFDAGPLILLPLHLHWPSITPFWSSSLKARPWSCYHPELISFWNVKCNNPTLTATFGTWISLSITHCPLVHLVSWLLSSFDSPPSPHLLTCFPSEARPCPIIPIPPVSRKRFSSWFPLNKHGNRLTKSIKQWWAGSPEANRSWSSQDCWMERGLKWLSMGHLSISCPALLSTARLTPIP